MHRTSTYGLIGVCFCSFLAAVTACSRRVDPKQRGSSEATAVNAEAAAIAKPPTAGEIRHVNPKELYRALREMRQKAIVLNVWATWCAPCREELPMLAKVQQAYAARGVAVVPLSVDGPEGEAKVPEILRDFGFRPPYYVVTPPIAAMKLSLYEGWLGNIPVTFLLNGSAQRRYFFNAEVYENELTPKLDALLDGTLPVGESNFGVAPGAEL